MTKIVFSAGDVNGIGLETFFKMMDELTEDWSRQCFFALAANHLTLEDYAEKTKKRINIEENFFTINNQNIQLINCNNASPVNWGKIDKLSAAHALESFIKSIDLVKSREFDALVTLPINKEAMALTGWKHPGHTEMLAESCGIADPLMILLTGNFRVALATIHVPLKDVSRLITQERVINLIKKFNVSLKADFGINDPKIAVLGLNPHAGEHGTIGDEEGDVIIPALEFLRSEKYIIDGPFPADGFFARESWKAYDGVFAMYHDQGLIPLKMEARDGGVNFTAGLPIVRTSPDHGTAFGIAGKGIASCDSLMAATQTAVQIVENRRR